MTLSRLLVYITLGALLWALGFFLVSMVFAAFWLIFKIFCAISFAALVTALLMWRR